MRSILPEMLIESEIREKAYRAVTFSAATFSFVAILAVFITLPMINNYVNSINIRLQSEMEYCKVNISFKLSYRHSSLAGSGQVPFS